MAPTIDGRIVVNVYRQVACDEFSSVVCRHCCRCGVDAGCIVPFRKRMFPRSAPTVDNSKNVGVIAAVDTNQRYGTPIGINDERTSRNRNVTTM